MPKLPFELKMWIMLVTLAVMEAVLVYLINTSI